MRDLKNNNMFEYLGKQLDYLIGWLFKFENNDIQMLFWSGFIGALLVFLIEYLRKPKLDITFLECGIDFNLPKTGKSKNWKIKVEYKKSILNILLFRYPVSNLRVTAKMSSMDGMFSKEYMLKADSNPNAYEEKDIPAALSKINLSKQDYEIYPLINKSEIGWLPFEVWSVFLDESLRNTLESGTYLFRIKAIADQMSKQRDFRIYIDKNELKIL